MQPASPPPAPAPAAPVPKVSSLALYAIAAIAIIAIAALFGYILFVSGLSFTTQLWWMGICGLIVAFLFYMVYAATHNRTVTFPLAGAFFVIGIGSFYGSIFVVIILATIWSMARHTERDAIRKSQRKVTP